VIGEDTGIWHPARQQIALLGSQPAQIVAHGASLLSMLPTSTHAAIRVAPPRFTTRADRPDARSHGRVAAGRRSTGEVTGDSADDRTRRGRS
jgi:hypothetical protein